MRIAINTDNDAFHPDAGPELARILLDLASRLENGEIPDPSWNLRDINGNTCGICTLAPVSGAELAAARIGGAS